MEEYLVKDGKRLRLGYTTGSCAAAAAKAAAWMLLTGRKKDTIRLQTPKGIELNLDVLETELSPDEVRCAIRKDSGDDPDVTRGTLIFAAVRKSATPGVTIDGGEGVGRVTKPGLDQPVGAAAINSVPRQMIEENVREVCALVGYDGGLDVTISAPEGEALAKKTFNPRLGIEGGISILGTTGIVEPMSEQALLDTIRVELRVDFLTKPVDTDHLIAAIERALRVDTLHRHGFNAQADLDWTLNDLRDREKDVLRLLLLENCSNKQIAERLRLSERTVENYRANIYRRLNVHGTDELRQLLNRPQT